MIWSSVRIVRIGGFREPRRLMDAVDPILIDQAQAALAGIEGIERVDQVRMR